MTLLKIAFTYYQKRLPLLPLIFLCLGITLSGIYLRPHKFALFPAFLSFLGIFTFLSAMCLLDDVKDYNKDRIAYKNRPLPAGLFSKGNAEFFLQILQGVFFAYSLVLLVFTTVNAAFAYALLAVFFWGALRDFQHEKWLTRHPLLFVLLKHLFIIPLAAFSALIVPSGSLWDYRVWALAGTLYGAFLCFTLCRQLNPRIHPVVAALIHFYGFRRVFEVTTLSIVLSALCGIALHLSSFLLPIQICLLASLATLFFHPSWFRTSELLASLSLFAHAWAVFFTKLLA